MLFNPIENTKNNDDQILNDMRSIMKTYVNGQVQNKVTKTMKENHQSEFENLRKKLQDPMLKEYSSFEFMEKLYLQEYLVGK